MFALGHFMCQHICDSTCANCFISDPKRSFRCPEGLLLSLWPCEANFFGLNNMRCFNGTIQTAF